MITTVAALTVTLWVSAIVGGDHDGSAYVSKDRAACVEAVQSARSSLAMQDDKGVVLDCQQVDLKLPKTQVTK